MSQGLLYNFVIGYILCIDSDLLLMAESRTQGMLVAPNTSTPSLSTPTPCIWTRNSVFILRADSDSFSLREPHRASTSSMNIMLGLFSRANENKVFTNLKKKFTKLTARICQI